MTLPPTLKCPHCEGSGWLRYRVPNPIYECGYSSHAKECRTCAGTGRALPQQDSKMLAAGGAQ